MEVIEPAVKGTLNVVGSCKKAECVKRVVLTSSVATVLVKRFTHNAVVSVDETCFSDPLYVQEIEVHYYLLIIFNSLSTLIIFSLFHFGNFRDGIFFPKYWPRKQQLNLHNTMALTW